MNKKAIEIYKLVLVEQNGWEEEDLYKLNLDEVECDPFYDKIVAILGLGEQE